MLARDIIACDVLVIGAGAAGWPAAVGAARALRSHGGSVLLVEEDPCPGGAAVDQFVAMPDGGPRSGIVSEFLAQLERRFPLTNRPVDRWWYFWYLPSDIMRVIGELLTAESNLQTLYAAHVSQLWLKGESVTGAVLHDRCGRERRIRAKVTIDATGTGALPEAAGADVRYGNDARGDFGEHIAPEAASREVQQCTWMYISQRLPHADPAWVPRGLESGYCSAPSHEDPGVVQRGAGIYLHWGCRLDCPDTREPAVLAETQREALARMAPALDELRAHGYVAHLAPRIGVREQSRVMGEAVVTANDLFAGRIPEDSVLITQRPIDIWRRGHEQMAYPEVKPYGIPYRALVPRRLDGLLVVGKHMSGSHLAMASYRVQCLLGQLGQAAGVAAALCARRDALPRCLDFAALSRLLTAPPQNLCLDRDPRRICPP